MSVRVVHREIVVLSERCGNSDEAVQIAERFWTALIANG
jgi:hypothetical protein